MPYHIIYIIIIDEHRINNNNKLSLILYYLSIMGEPGPVCQIIGGGGPGPFGPGESAPMSPWTQQQLQFFLSSLVGPCVESHTKLS